jgi:glycosyltransferase involved in cell wall biosynthesis
MTRRHAMVVHAYYPLGETRVQREAMALRQAGWTVDVICLRNRGEARTEDIDGVRVVRLPIGRNRTWGMAFQLVEYLGFLLAAAAVLTARHLRRRYHSVQVHNLPDFLVFAALVPKMTGARVLLDLHDLMPEFLGSRLGLSMRHPLVRLVALQERLSCGFADTVVTVTDRWRDRLVERGVDPSKVAVVMNVADPALFSRRDTEPSHEEFRVLYHGTLTHRYGVDLLIEAAHLLTQRLPRLRMWILGDGDARSDLMETVGRLGLEATVEFSEGMLDVPSLQSYLLDADVGVVPNRSTRFTDDLLPTKLLEYVAVGIPVVTARTPMIDSLFDERQVEFFAPGDAADLAKRLEMLAGAPERRREMVQATAGFVEEHRWDHIARRYVSLVEGGR